MGRGSLPRSRFTLDITRTTEVTSLFPYRMLNRNGAKVSDTPAFEKEYPEMPAQSSLCEPFRGSVVFPTHDRALTL